jgi:hypothetical protein
MVGRYVSLERIIEETKEDYYRAIKESSAGWLQGRHDIIPWWDYFLSTLRMGYRELAERVEKSSSVGRKTQLIEQAIFSQSDPFTLGDIQNLHPSASAQLIKKVLAGLKRQGKVRLEGKGRGAKWTRR